ncbi:RAVE_protein 1 C terminal domain-containing protein [Hexamita inflata]|uniref:RAVE_protein 1 C terminal domain-containing protein n=1 Tax=Hexamita inflata TaxID=28002 RepID=A0ABP1IKS3_9EUKA
MDYITEKVYHVTHESGVSNLSVSKQQQRLIVRFRDQFYEYECDSYIEILRSRFTTHFVHIFICSQRSFYILTYNFEECALQFIKSFSIAVTEMSQAFYPNILIKSQKVLDMPQSPYYILNVDNLNFKLPELKNPIMYKAQSACEELYLVQSGQNVYLFDIHEHKNLTKISLQSQGKVFLTYMANIQTYFLFVIYDSMKLDVLSLMYLHQNKLKTVVIKNQQTIQLNTASKIKSKFVIKDIYAQLLVTQPNQLFYSVIIKTTIADKSNLFIKCLIQYDEQCNFVITDDVNLLYLNISTSLIQPCQYSEKILFYVDNRAYLTKNLRVCDDIIEVEGKIIAATFQLVKDDEFVYLLSCQQKELIVTQHSILKSTSIQTKIDLEYIGDIVNSQIIINRNNIYCLVNDQVIVINKAKQVTKSSCITNSQNILIIQQNYAKILSLCDNTLKLFAFDSDQLESQESESFVLEEKISLMHYHPTTDSIQFKYGQREEVAFSNNLSQRFDYQDNSNKLFTIWNQKIETIAKTKYGLTQNSLKYVPGNADEFCSIIATYASEQPAKQFISLPNGYYVFQPDTDQPDELTLLKNTNADQNLQFEQMNQMLVNALKYNAVSVPIFAHFLSMNQLHIVERITKFNKNEVSPWLAEYYSTIDPVNKPLPKVTLDQLMTTQLLVLSPVYHLVDIIFSAAQNDYKINKDAFKVAIYFALVNKIQLLANLFKLSKQDKIAEFLKRDFEVVANQQAASKNAFTLLSQHKHELAAAWFIIGRKYQDAIRLMAGKQYMNSKILAFRSCQILLINKQIQEEEYKKLLQMIYDDSSYECQGDYKLLVNCFVTRRLIALQLNMQTNQDQYLELCKFIGKQTDVHIAGLTEEQLQYLTSFVLCAHYFNQNEDISKLLLSFVQRLMLQISSVQLNVTAQRMAVDLGIKLQSIYNYQQQKNQVCNIATTNDLSIDKIIEIYKDQLIHEEQFQAIKNTQRQVLTLQLIYSHSQHFQQQFSNAKFIQLGFQRKLNVNIYHINQKLKLTWMEAANLVFTLVIMRDLLMADATQFAIYNKILEVFQKTMGVELEQQSASSFQDAHNIIKDKIYSDFEKNLLNAVISDVDPLILEQVEILIEQSIFKQLQKIQIYPQYKQISAYIDTLRIQQKNIKLDLQKLGYQDSMMIILRTYPVVLGFYNGKMFNIIQVDNKVPKIVQSLEAEQISVGKYSSGFMIVQKEKIVHYKQTFTTDAVGLQTVQYQPTYQFDRDNNSRIALQLSRHKMIAMSHVQLQIHFLQNDYLKTFVKNVNEIPELAQLTKITDLKLVNENNVIAIGKKLNQDILIRLRLNDLLYEHKQQAFVKELDFEPESISQFETDNQHFVVVCSPKEFRTFHLLDNDLVQILNMPISCGKKVQFRIYENDDKYCCCTSFLRAVSSKVHEFCCYCGKEFTVEGQTCVHEGVTIEGK